LAELKCARYELADKSKTLALHERSQKITEARQKSINQGPSEKSKVRPRPRSELPPIRANRRPHVTSCRGAGFKVTRRNDMSKPKPAEQVRIKSNLYTQSNNDCQRNRTNNKKGSRTTESKTFSCFRPLRKERNQSSVYTSPPKGVYRTTKNKTNFDGGKSSFKNTDVSNKGSLKEEQASHRFTIRTRNSSLRYQKKSISLSSGERMCRAKINLSSTKQSNTG